MPSMGRMENEFFSHSLGHTGKVKTVVEVLQKNAISHMRSILLNWFVETVQSLKLEHQIGYLVALK